MEKKMGLFRKNDGTPDYDGISSFEKEDMIKRLERERERVNDEIESILKSYARESGNRALKPKRRKKYSDDWGAYSGR